MISKEICGSVVEDTIRHLLSLVKTDGSYVYSHPINSVDEAHDGYNVLRHCGTTWYLCKAIVDTGHTLSDEDFDRVLRSIGYVKDRLVEPPWKEGILPRLCLPEDGEVKIGANGLALLMLHEFSRLLAAHPSRNYAQDTLVTARLENYILSQLSPGDFVHKRVLSNGAITAFRSDY